MKLLVLMGPPRCGLNAIASLVSMCADMFTCPFEETHQRLERLLRRMDALARLRVNRGQPPLPQSSCQLRLTPEEAYRVYSSYMNEAKKKGHTTEKFVVVPERLLLPLTCSMAETLSENITWLWISRRPSDVERSCVATKWMPRLPRGKWIEYTIDLQKHADSFYERIPQWYEISSDPIFQKDTTQLASVIGELGCCWNSQQIGGFCENRK